MATSAKSESTSTPNTQRSRVVVVTRKTLYEGLLDQQGTPGQAEFFLKARGQKLAPLKAADVVFHENLSRVRSEVPADQRRVSVDRDQLDRFLFAPDDIVLAVGQDGLVPNVAKYLSGQLVIGVNPDPERYDGVLCRHKPADVPKLLAWAERTLALGHPADGHYQIERRTMAVAERDDGIKLLALNEVFIGHRSHQSARYRLVFGSQQERHSSSGLICSTGTGCTGWARSISTQWGLRAPLPSPQDAGLAFFVREPFPSVTTGISLAFGLLRPGDAIEVFSEMPDNGVVFCDGIENDRLDFLNGQIVKVGVADRTLNLVIPTAVATAAPAQQQIRPSPPQQPQAQTDENDDPRYR